MTIVAEKYAYVIGVDTHARTHTYAIINTTTGARARLRSLPRHRRGHETGLRVDRPQHHRGNPRGRGRDTAPTARP